MKKVAILLMCGLGIGAAVAEESDSPWVHITSTTVDGLHAEISAKKGSFIHANKASSLLVQQTTTRKDNGESSVYFYKATVSDEACDNGYGSLVYYNLKGQKEFENDYIEGGNSVASGVGGVICGLKADPPEQSQR